jgi:hypothetical protein
MNYEYLWTSMAGSYWIDCEFICRNNLINEVTIRYFDDFIGGEVEASVDAERVRVINQPS